MGPYVARRLLQAVAVLFLLSIIFFVIFHLLPGGPCQALFQPPPECGEPVANQYLIWLDNVLRGNFGATIHGSSVSAVILQTLPPTMLLVAVSYAIQQLIALPLGVYAALRQYSLFDGVLSGFSYVALSLPAFVLGLFLLYLFAGRLLLLPAGQVEDASLPLFGSGAWFGALWHQPGFVLGDLALHLVLPAFVLTVTGIAVDSRFMRGAMLDVLREDYIRTAYAKGLARRRVVFKHAFRNALLPIITNVGLYLPSLISGVVLVETVFSWTGLGYTFAWAIRTQDFATLQSILILSALAVLIANLLADLAYAWADPRIRYG